VRERGADPRLCKGVLGQGGQPCGDIHSPCHPLGLALKKARDGCGAQALIVPQGTDHAPLVEGGEGTRGGVGREQHALVLVRFAGALQDHGDEPPSALPPGLQAFEAVQHFEASVGQGHDTDGQGREILGQVGGGTGSQRGVAGPQALGGQEAQIPCGHLRGGATELGGRARGAYLSHGELPAPEAQKGWGRPGRRARRGGRRGCATASALPTPRGRP